MNLPAALILSILNSPLREYPARVSQLRRQRELESPVKAAELTKLGIVAGTTLPHRGELQSLFPIKHKTKQFSDVLISSFSHICK